MSETVSQKVKAAGPEGRDELDGQLARQLADHARAQGTSLVGPDGLLGQLTKLVFETGLEAELSEHLGYEPREAVGRNSGNSRNGARSKTVITDAGPIELKVPRDRNGSFDPQLVRKRQRRLTGIDDMVCSLVAKGLTTGEVSAHLAQVYGADVSKDTISRITDRVLEGMSDWQNRPLDRVYPVVFIDCLVVKIRDGQVSEPPDLHRHWRHRRWRARHPRTVGRHRLRGGEVLAAGLNRNQNRGVEDVCIVVCDGLKGLPESITATWPAAVTQTCVIHLLRNSFRYASGERLGGAGKRPAHGVHGADGGGRLGQIC